MKLIEFINTFISGPFRICQIRHTESTISIIYNSILELPDGIADKLTVAYVEPAFSQAHGLNVHIWCYDREELINGQSSI